MQILFWSTWWFMLLRICVFKKKSERKFSLHRTLPLKIRTIMKFSFDSNTRGDGKRWKKTTGWLACWLARSENVCSAAEFSLYVNNPGASAKRFAGTLS